MSALSIKNLLLSLSLLACTSAYATPLVVNVAGLDSYGNLGESRNAVLTFDVGADARIVSIGYAVNVTAYRQQRAKALFPSRNRRPSAHRCRRCALGVFVARDRVGMRVELI